MRQIRESDIEAFEFFNSQKLVYLESLNLPFSTIDYLLTLPWKGLTSLRNVDNHILNLSYRNWEGSGTPSMDDFEVWRIIGLGGFSTVVEVWKKSNGCIYAMKIIWKDLIVRKDKVKQIMSERRILESLKQNNMFIMNLHSAFTSQEYLHLVLDFCPGGELFYHLSWNGRMSEKIAKFYFCEVLLAID